MILSLIFNKATMYDRDLFMLYSNTVHNLRKIISHSVVVDRLIDIKSNHEIGIYFSRLFSLFHEIPADSLRPN